MKKIFNKVLYILPLAFLYGCEPEFDDIEFNQGSADFSRTVAVGNSLFAGYQSGAVSAEGQLNSLPNMVATQLKTVGGGDFKQPIIPGEAGEKGAGIVDTLIVKGLLVPEFSLTYTTDCLNETSLGPALLPKANPIFSAAGFLSNVSASGPYNNVSIPGAQVTHLGFAGYAAANPYFSRIAGSPGETVLQAAAKVNHTFFMMWIGNNDVLGYATSGGQEGGGSITSQAAFEATYGAALDALSSNGQKGVIANIPYVTSIPYFYAVPTGTDAITTAQADQLMNGVQGMPGYGNGYNAALQGAAGAGLITQAEADKRKIYFTAGQFNRFVVEDTTLTNLTGLPAPLPPSLPNIRQLKAGEVMVLTTPGDKLKCELWGTAVPIEGKYYLSNAEISAIISATDAYNSFIANQASTRGLAFVDANARMKELATTGISINGIDFTNEFVSGGAFSLDGVHPSTRGYAIIANDFISAINSKFGANIPKVDVTSYKAIEVKQ